MPGHLPEAISEFEAEIRESPGDAGAHVNLGRALLQVPGREHDAIRELETALRMQPDPNVKRMIEQVRAHAR
jgi:predicted Zn-dependent protease